MSSHPIATPPRYMSQPLGAMPSRGPSGLRLPAFPGAIVPRHQGRVVICDTRHCPRPINSADSSDQRTSPISLGGMVSPITCRCTVKKRFSPVPGWPFPLLSGAVGRHLRRPAVTAGQCPTRMLAPAGRHPRGRPPGADACSRHEENPARLRLRVWGI